MAVVRIEHEDFTLEFTSAKYSVLLEKARKNGLTDETLFSRWGWSAGVQKVEFLSGEDAEPKEMWTKGAAEMPREPFFFDNAQQDVWIDFKPGCTKISRPELRNAEASARFKIKELVLCGPLEFGNDIGRSDFAFTYERDGVSRRFCVSFDVLSTKLDYHNDWKKIVNDVESEYRMLAYDFLKRTYHTFKEDAEGDTSDMIWWNVFRKVREDFVNACRLILSRPKTRHRRVEEWLRADQLKRLTPQLENEIAEHRGEVARLYRSVLDDDSRDTPENRFFKFAVESIVDRHALLAERVRAEAERRNADKHFLDEIDLATEQLTEIRANPFFRGIGRFEGLKQVSLVLQQGVGYADVMRIYGVLAAFYDLHDGIFNLETKDIAELYEIWCFIEVKNRVANIVEATPSEVKHICRGELGNLFGVDLKTGKKSKILIEKDDIKLELYYNPKTVEDGQSAIDGTSAPTGGTQKPDIVLQLVREYEGVDKFRLTYLFDAKYRIDKTTAAQVDTPPEDAINQMHRYRDAIYYGDIAKDEALKKEVVGGYILFPGGGADEDIRKTYFYESIAKVNIGALPLRPGAEANGKMLEEFIAGLIHKETENQLQESIPPKGAILPIATMATVTDSTVYGTCHGETQLNWVKTAGLYNLPRQIAIAQGILDDRDAARKSLLAIVPNERRMTDPLQFFRVEESLGLRDKAFLKEHGYPSKGDRGPYYVWKVSSYSVKKLADLKIVSDGQTGVNQGALQAAIDLGLEYRGWASKCWLTENGKLDKRFRSRMQEHVSTEYTERMKANIRDSHATLILTDDYPLSGDVLLTQRTCEGMMHSRFIAAFTETDIITKTQKWLRGLVSEDFCLVLNVAGPRESKAPGIQERTRRFLVELIRTL